MGAKNLVVRTGKPEKTISDFEWKVVSLSRNGNFI
jgi:hypothetical protein